MSRTAVVLLDFGGPERPGDVRPFLRNLFSDPLILRVPGVLRPLLSRLIASRRAPSARSAYARIGGGSPIRENAERQAEALERILREGGGEFRVLVAMRYWHPFAREAVRKAKDWRPDRVVLLPLCPQYATATTKSFLRAWREAAAVEDFRAPVAAICCWPRLDGFAAAAAAAVRRELDRLPDGIRRRVLFSAHGLPKKFVEDGDPYQAQVERSVAAIVSRLSLPGLDHAICYQSRVGRLEWLRPYAEDEIRRAGREGLALVVAPVSFANEHVETLVELDVAYAELAASAGVRHYRRARTVSEDPAFIEGLAVLARRAVDGLAPGGEACGPGLSGCPLAGS